jgi:hypothetical protein
MSLADRVKERFRKRLARWIDKERAAVGCAEIRHQAGRGQGRHVPHGCAPGDRSLRQREDPGPPLRGAAHVHTLKAPRRRMTMVVLRSREMA